MTPTLTPHDRIVAYVRTLVPYAIGAAVAWLLVRDITLDAPFVDAVTAFAVALVTNIYYVGVRLLERRLPKLGVLLGFPKSPEYADTSTLWASVVRTGIPTLVGAGVAAAAAYMGFLSAETRAVALVVIVAIVEAAYYAAARWATSRWPRSLGWLLGDFLPPTYKPARHAL